MAVDSGKVKELRDKTGLPMMDCKRALERTGGDVEKAYEELRKAGLKAQEKLAGRTAKEGRVGSLVSPDGRLGVLATLRCETEPVGKNEEFQKLLGGLVAAVAKDGPKDEEALKALEIPPGGTVGHALTELVNRIRENISLGKFLRFEADAVVQYVHFDQKKAAMVALAGGSTSDPKVAELGKELCMHIVFARPTTLSRDRLDQELVAREREILLAAAKHDPKNAQKPEQILAKIVEGQIEKFVASQCLLEQPYVRDEKITVAQFVTRSGTGASVVDFGYVATDI